MIVFLIIGSGDVQTWAVKHPTEPTLPEETPLSGSLFF
jgi:hypothetical protein